MIVHFSTGQPHYLVHAIGTYEQETVMFDLHKTTVLTAGGSATTQVVKSHRSHVPVETSAAECMGGYWLLP